MSCCWSGVGAVWLAAVSAALGLMLLIRPTPLHFGSSLPEDLARALEAWPRCREAGQSRRRAGGVTVISSVDGERLFLFALRETARRAGWELRLPGYGQPWVSTAYSTKLVMREMQDTDPCAIVLVMDGFDTLIHRPETLDDIMPPNGKVLITPAFLGADKRWSARRFSQVVYGTSDKDLILNNGVLLGRAGDVGRLSEATAYLAARFGVFAKQWGLNVMMSGAGPAFSSLFEELVQVDYKGLLQSPDFVKGGKTLVVHQPTLGNLLPVVAELGIEIPLGWKPPLDFSDPSSVRKHRQQVTRKFASMHCHRSWLLCAQGQLLLRLVDG